MSTNKPLLTVGLPVFNGERYLGNAIECILSQSFKDFDFIISDNASTDGTEEICRHYARRDRRIRYHRNAVNMGGAKNSDLILDMATTEFFTTASHDDYFSLNYLEACLAKLQQTQDAMLCCPEQVVFLDPRGNPTRVERNCNTEGKDLVGRMHELVKKLGWYAWYGVTRTDVLRSLLNGMRRYRYAYGGDVIFMATALTRGHIVVSQGTTFFYREPDRAKEFATHMEEILPGSEAPTRAYTGLAGDLLQVVLDSDLPEYAKSEACQEMLRTIANQPEWVTVLARENADAVIGELAARLPQMRPVCPRVSGQRPAGENVSDGPADRLRLVAVAPFPVCPPSSASEQRIAQLYQGLVGRCHVDLITLTGPDVAAGQFNISPGLKEIRIAKSRMHLRREVDLNKAAGVPVEDIGMIAWAGETPDYVDTLRECLADADIVCISQPYLFPIITRVWSGPVVYDAHRIETDSKRQVLPDSPVKEILLQSVERVERACVIGSTLILCSSEEERRRLNELYGVPFDRLHIVPHGYTSGSVPFVGSKDRRTRMAEARRPPIAFFSGAHVPASVQAVRHILSFAKQLVDIQFIVAGRVCEAYQDLDRPKNVRFVGQLTDEDKKQVLGLAAVALYPTEGETDTRATVIECFAAGVPVVSSQCGVRGLDVVDGRHCRICDIAEFPSVISQIVADSNADAISVMVDQAFAYVGEQFDWSKISQRLLEETHGFMKAIDSWQERQTATSTSTVCQSSPVRRSRKNSVGINVIGHVSGNLGLGVTARNVVRALIDRGCAVSILDLDPGLGRGAHDKTYQHRMVASADQLPHAINLFVLPPTTIAMLYEGSRQLFARNTLNIAFAMWELSVLPVEFRPALEALDLIIAESEYIRHTFQCHLSGVHTTYAPHPLYVPDGIVGERSRFGVPDDSVLFVTGFEPYSDVERKNTRSVINAFRSSLGSDPRAYLLIKVNNPMEDGQLHGAVTALQTYARGCDRIRFITDSFSYEEVLRLYAAADVYVSLHRAEGLGLGMMEAMALGKPVIATGWSGNMSFMDHRCACLVRYRLIPANGTMSIYQAENLGSRAMWAEPNIDDAVTWMRRLADDPTLRQEIGRKARAHMEEFQRIARRGDCVDEIEMLWRHREYQAQGACQGKQQSGLSKPVDRGTPPPDIRHNGKSGVQKGRTERPLRILFQNRATAKSHPGGDTVVMDLFRRELQQLGHRVDVALGPSSLDGYDLVQAFNFATPEVTEDYARRATAANVPLIIATIYEDWPKFLTQSRAMTEVLRHYVECGRDQAGFTEGIHMVRRLPAAKRSMNDYAARHAACLLAWSESEKARLIQDYPDSRRVEVVTLGADHLNVGAVDPTLFEQAYGVKDFVLCVGRLETRKNQLMLLKALEHDKSPIVFLTGGFTYQPNYVKLCRMFDRPGKTLFLDRVPDDMLAAAYQSARVLCMPSWYELPGLVALEALQLGCPVVASRWGTLPDYVPHGVEYCEPDEPDDIRASILRAYERKEPVDHRELVCGFRWRESAERLLSVYEDVLCRGRRPDWTRDEVKPESEASVGARREERYAGPKSESAFVCSIIVPVSGDVELTKRCLTAISEATDDIEYEVILIDNACSREMQELFGTLGGDVKVIRIQEPVEYARAYNLGAQAARGRYLVFLCHKMAPMDGWLRALVSEVDGHQEIGVVAGKSVHLGGTIQHGGIVFGRAERLPYYTDIGASGDSPSVNQRREYQAVSGACLLISRSRFMEMGGYDEQLGDGFEVVDLCLKVRESGLRVVYQPRAMARCLGTVAPGFFLQEQDHAKRLLERWGDHWWLVDEDLQCHVDGYKVIRNEVNNTAVASKQLLDGVKDQAAWAHVAATQAAALKKDWQAVRRELALADEWPKDPSVLSWGAMVAERLQESGSRIRFLTRHVELGNDPTERLALVRTLLEHKEIVCAEEQLRMVFTASPNHADGLLLKGILCMQREQYGPAEDAFASALREGADRKKCLMGMGMAAMGRAYAQGAWERFVQVLVDHPNDPEAIHWLLRAGTAQNRWEELADHLRAYVTRNPSDLAIRFALASVLLRGEETEAARREYDALRTDAPAYDGLDQLGQMIAGRATPLTTGAVSR